MPYYQNSITCDKYLKIRKRLISDSFLPLDRDFETIVVSQIASVVHVTATVKSHCLK